MQSRLTPVVYQTWKAHASPEAPVWPPGFRLRPTDAPPTLRWSLPAVVRECTSTWGRCDALLSSGAQRRRGSPCKLLHGEMRPATRLLSAIAIHCQPRRSSDGNRTPMCGEELPRLLRIRAPRELMCNTSLRSRFWGLPRDWATPGSGSPRL